MSKTKLMVFGSRQMLEKVGDFHLLLLGKEIVPTMTAKDLGVILDPNLIKCQHFFSNHALVSS